MSTDENFLSRWSRLKREARHEPAEPAPLAVPPTPPVPAPASSDVQPSAEPAPLPPIDTLTPQSDFSGFMKPEVDPSLRRQALKALFQDPRFNVMDGLDVYIDDYSKPDPLPEGWLEKMSQMARLGAYEPPAEEPPKEGRDAAEASGAQQPGDNPLPEPPAPDDEEQPKSDTV